MWYRVAVTQVGDGLEVYYLATEADTPEQAIIDVGRLLDEEG
jgi:hypothetical protein